MQFTETTIPGAFVVEIEPHTDERGLFARTFCREEFARHGLADVVAQCSVSFNERAGTLRGMHYQAPPSAEAKLVRCTSGAIHDVVVDLRPDSRTYLRWVALELRADAHTALYIPVGCAHGFQTLVDRSEVFYQMSDVYVPAHDRGFRYDDPSFGIRWPLAPTRISDRDLALGPFDPLVPSRPARG